MSKGGSSSACVGSTMWRHSQWVSAEREVGDASLEGLLMVQKAISVCEDARHRFLQCLFSLPELLINPFASQSGLHLGHCMLATSAQRLSVATVANSRGSSSPQRLFTLEIPTFQACAKREDKRRTPLDNRASWRNYHTRLTSVDKC